jgi:hypothetical protein
MLALLLVAPLAFTTGCMGEIEEDENVGEVQQAGAGVSPFLKIIDIEVDGTFVAPCIDIPVGVREAAQQGADLGIDFDIAFEDGSHFRASVPIANMTVRREVSSNTVTVEATFDTGRTGIVPCMSLSSAELDTPGGGQSDAVDVISNVSATP